jgi:hypothetical protein
MAVRYYHREGRRVPWYYCSRGPLRLAANKCQEIPGASIDEAIGKLIVEVVSPMALEVALSVDDELKRRFEEADRLRKEQVERARYEAEAARRRYLRVDPDNRLVADTLEADWNDKLRTLTQAQEEYERRRQADQSALAPQNRERIAALATDFPAVWRAPFTEDRDRKRSLRLLIDDVTLVKGRDEIAVHVRFRGGATRSVSLPRPLPSWKMWLTPADVIAEIDRQMDSLTDSEIADALNKRGLLSGQGHRFSRDLVGQLRLKHSLKSRHDRLRERGMLTADELASKVGVSRQTVLKWRRKGLLRAHAYTDKHQCLYDPAGDVPPAVGRWKRVREATQNR